MNLNTSCLLGCIQSLLEVRMQLHHSLDPSVRVELDVVIRRLQAYSDQEADERQWAKVVDSVLLLLGRLIGVTTNVSDLIDRYKR